MGATYILGNPYRYNPDDIYIVIISAVVLAIARYAFTKLIFSPLAKLYGLTEKQKEYHKFLENSWYTLWYTFSTFACLFVLWNEAWLWDHRTTYLDIPKNGPISEQLRYYYLVELGYSIQMALMYLLVDNELDDWIAMCIHHCVTILLVIFSYMTLHHQEGTMVQIAHDFVDIFLYSAKACHNLGIQMGANVLFMLFVITKLLCRLIYFPWVIIIPGTYLAFIDPDHPPLYSYIPNSPLIEIGYERMCFNGYCLSPHICLVGLTASLYCIHIYWSTLVYKMLKRTILNKGVVQGDIREVEHKKNYDDVQST